MGEERRRILEMLATGKISADEADRLLDAMVALSPSERPANERTATMTTGKLPRYLRVMVENGAEEGGETVNIRIPMQLLRAGIKLAAIIPPAAQHKVEEAMASQGMSFKLSDLTPEMLDELIAGLGELMVDVNDKDERVRVFCE